MKEDKSIVDNKLIKKPISDFKPPRTDYDGLMAWNISMEEDMPYLNDIAHICKKHGVSVDQPLENAIGQLQAWEKDCDIAENFALEVRDWGAWTYGLDIVKLHDFMWKEFKFANDPVAKYMDDEAILDAKKLADAKFEEEYDKEVAEANQNENNNK